MVEGFLWSVSSLALRSLSIFVRVRYLIGCVILTFFPPLRPLSSQEEMDR